jgi:hypothetical protein
MIIKMIRVGKVQIGKRETISSKPAKIAARERNGNRLIPGILRPGREHPAEPGRKDIYGEENGRRVFRQVHCLMIGLL